jgi:hypothetical protein
MRFEVFMAMTLKIALFWDVTVQLAKYIPTFWRNMPPPSSGQKTSRQMEEEHASETLVPSN